MKCSIKLKDTSRFYSLKFTSHDLHIAKYGGSIFINVEPHIEAFTFDADVHPIIELCTTTLKEIIFEHSHEEEHFRRLILIKDII